MTARAKIVSFQSTLKRSKHNADAERVDGLIPAQAANGGKLRVAAYVRMEGHTDDKFDVDTQREYYTGLIAAHADWEFKGVFIDVCYSAARKRPQLEELKRLCHDGAVDFIIIRSFWRLYHDPHDVYEFTREMRECGVDVAFLNERFNSAILTDANMAMIEKVSQGNWEEVSWFDK